MRQSVKNELLWLCGLGAGALLATGRWRAALAPALAVGALAGWRSRPRARFAGQSAFVRGASRGLGFTLARELVREGANVTIVARDRAELKRAQGLLTEAGCGRVHMIVCDVTDPPALERAIRGAASEHGGLDLLVNNAGSITVGPWETMAPEDFEAQMELHVYAPMNALRFALPFLRDERSGKRVVNICSMGGRVAVPHMLPYDTSKFALAGFSQGVGAELAHEGISVTTIYPALMRTGSPIQAVFKGDHEKEFAWFQAGDVLPGLSLSAESAARKILEAARERRWELMPSWPAKARMAVAASLPELMGETMGLLNRALPKGDSQEHRTGAQSRALFDRSLWTRPLRARAREAEQEFNQKPQSDARFNMGLSS